MDKYMDKFPDNFNRTYLETEFKKNQEILVRKTRKLFHDKILSNIQDYQKNIKLKFDPKLWKSSRFMIVEELLNVHGSLQIMTMSGQSIEINLSSNLPVNEFVNFVVIRL